MKPKSQSRESNDDILHRNLEYISAISTFNSERSQQVIRYFDFIFRKNLLRKQKISLDDIIKFCRKTQQSEVISKRNPNDLIDEIIITYPLDVPVLWNLFYIIYRYGHLDDLIKRTYGFSLYTLIFVERAIRELIYSCEANYELLDIVHVFESKTEYIDICNIVEPDNTYRFLWQKCIFIPKDEILVRSLDLIESFSTTARVVSTIKIPRNFNLNELINEIETVLHFLSINLVPKNEYTDFPLIFLKPIFKLDYGETTFYAVPFPFLLGTLTVFRIESMIQKSKEIKNIEEDSVRGKGSIAEKIALDSLKIFPAKNLIRDFRYKVNNQEYQSDGLLILEKSIWAIEVKGHPIFRKLPLDPKKIIPTFNRKVINALKQGFRTLDALTNLKEFQYHLSHLDKEFDKMEKGVIVVLDGYIPTLFTQNKEMDEYLGTHIIYDHIREGYRVYITTIIDLFLLSSQPDYNNFEEFLLWRTGYLSKMPIISYNEREYWAFYNDNFLVHKEIRENFHKLIEKEIKISYISSRFNFKTHLKKILERNINTKNLNKT